MAEEHFSRQDEDLALKVLEHDQLAQAKAQRYPRRRLGAIEKSVVWGLRIYLIFMLAVVLYQVVSGAK
jgi:hypothetical protein